MADNEVNIADFYLRHTKEPGLILFYVKKKGPDLTSIRPFPYHFVNEILACFFSPC